MDHIALGVPVLILPITKYFNKLFEDGSLTTIAPLSKLGRIMIVTVYAPIMFIIAILSPEDGRAERAGEMVYVVFAIESSDIGAAQGAATLVT